MEVDYQCFSCYYKSIYNGHHGKHITKRQQPKSSITKLFQFAALKSFGVAFAKVFVQIVLISLFVPDQGFEIMRVSFGVETEHNTQQDITTCANQKSRAESSAEAMVLVN